MGQWFVEMSEEKAQKDIKQWFVYILVYRQMQGSFRRKKLEEPVKLKPIKYSWKTAAEETLPLRVKPERVSADAKKLIYEL